MVSSKDSEFLYFRSEFNKTLKLYFNERIDLSVLPQGLNLNIQEMSSLILLVEREKEIQDFPGAPPERYTLDSFLEDLDNVGVGSDKEVSACIKDLVSLGFIFQNQNEIKPSETAFKIVNFINNLFPGMPGINFIAYVVQTIDEVHSDRKSLAEGKEVFYQTLKSRSSTKKGAAEKEAIKSINQDASKKERQGVSSKALKQRLSQLRKSRQNRDDSNFKKVEVKSVFSNFDKKEKVEEKTEEPVEVQDLPAAKDEQPQDEIESEEITEEIKEPEISVEQPEPEDIRDVKRDNFDSDKSPEEDVPGKVKSEDIADEAPEPVSAKDEEPEYIKPDKSEEIKDTKESILPQKEAVSESEPQNKEEKPSDAIKNEEPPEPTDEEREPEAVEKIVSDEDIEKKISAFEHELAMTCPVCNEGKVHESQTEKGKSFYQCTNDFCHFISWAKPFHYPCPVCGNSFLVEFIGSGGLKGLKCPRATCDYSQADQINPANREKPKKKKKVVRRVKRKK